MRTALALAVAAAAAAATPAAASSALDPGLATAGLTAQSGLDYGDAPDGRPARYADKPRVRGRFPSRRVSGGPRHASSGPSIGGWTAEADSRQVDADRDDAAQVTPRSCQVSTLTVVVDASRADLSATLYANAWFDWNQDGDWADGGTQRCGPEWGIQNMVIDPASLGDDRVALVTLRFRAGRVPNQFWWRVQLHAGAPVPHLGSGGQSQPTSGGETEDWFFDRLPRPKAPKIKLQCNPAHAVISHGQRLNILRQLKGRGDARVSIRDVRHELGGMTDGLVLREDTGDNTFNVDSMLEHERDPHLQHAFVRVTVDALVNGRKRRFRETCTFVVAHTERIAPPGPPPKVLTPAFRVKINPNQPDPVAARCAARAEQFGQFGDPSPRNNAVSVQCDGIDIKSFSVAAGAGITYVQKSLDPAVSCAKAPNGRSFLCYIDRKNKGRDEDVTFGTAGPSSMRIHILAGGRGRGGTAIVLLQDYFPTRDGIVCKQSVPRAEQCAALEPSG